MRSRSRDVIGRSVLLVPRLWNELLSINAIDLGHRAGWPVVARRKLRDRVLGYQYR